MRLTLMGDPMAQDFGKARGYISGRDGSHWELGEKSSDRRLSIIACSMIVDDRWLSFFLFMCQPRQQASSVITPSSFSTAMSLVS